MHIRKLFLKIHLYSGLICFWYLIILGTSSLNFNHHFSFMARSTETETWQRKVLLPNNVNDDLRLSENLRDSLRLIGWPLPWETWHDSTGVFHFALEQPGKRYVVDYNFQDQTARVQETAKGLWPVFNALHGSGSVPNSAFMQAWKWYTRITVLLVVTSVFAGVYLWYKGNRDKKAGKYTLLVSLAFTLAWMLQMYLMG